MTTTDATARTDAQLVSGGATRPQNAEEYLASLDDGRKVFIYGEEIPNVAEHPAYRN